MTETTDKALRPRDAWQQAMDAIYEDVRYGDPFKGLRVTYNTNNPAMKAADTARDWWNKAKRYFHPDVQNYAEVRRYLKATKGKINEALGDDRLSAKAREILPVALQRVERAITAIEAADKARDDAENAERATKEGNFPQNRDRRTRLEFQGQCMALAADFFEFFGWSGDTPGWGTPVRSLEVGLDFCADEADKRQRPEAVGELLRKAAGAAAEGKPRRTWGALYEAAQEMEKGGHF